MSTDYDIDEDKMPEIDVEYVWAVGMILGLVLVVLVLPLIAG